MKRPPERVSSKGRYLLSHGLGLPFPPSETRTVGDRSTSVSVFRRSSVRANAWVNSSSVDTTLAVAPTQARRFRRPGSSAGYIGALVPCHM